MDDIPATATATASSTSTGTATATGPSTDLLPTQPVGTPAAGGWAPDKYTPLIAAIVVGISTSTCPILMMPEPKWNYIVAGVIAGLASGFGTFFGVRSAGPRSP